MRCSPGRPVRSRSAPRRRPPRDVAHQRRQQARQQRRPQEGFFLRERVADPDSARAADHPRHPEPVGDVVGDEGRGADLDISGVRQGAGGCPDGAADPRSARGRRAPSGAPTGSCRSPRAGALPRRGRPHRSGRAARTAAAPAARRRAGDLAADVLEPAAYHLGRVLQARDPARQVFRQRDRPRAPGAGRCRSPGPRRRRRAAGRPPRPLRGASAGSTPRSKRRDASDGSRCRRAVRATTADRSAPPRAARPWSPGRSRWPRRPSRRPARSGRSRRR